jgi:hypothetical protein
MQVNPNGDPQPSDVTFDGVQAPPPQPMPGLMQVTNMQPSSQSVTVGGQTFAVTLSNFGVMFGAGTATVHVTTGSGWNAMLPVPVTVSYTGGFSGGVKKRPKKGGTKGTKKKAPKSAGKAKAPAKTKAPAKGAPKPKH